LDNKFRVETQVENAQMPRSVKNALLGSVPVLVLLGLLAGALGGLGIGLIQSKAASSTTSGGK
jgi:hypothetical protein